MIRKQFPELYYFAPSIIVGKEGQYYYAMKYKDKYPFVKSSDASEVIQSALSSLTPDRTWKERVVLKGNFTITSPIRVPSYTILEIRGKLKAVSDIDLIENSDQENGNMHIEIIGGELDGDKSNRSGGTALIDFVKVKYCIIHSVYVHDGYLRGIQLYGGSEKNIVVNCILENNGKVTDSGDGILLDGNENIAIGNICINNEGYNIYVRTGYRNVVADNICLGGGITYTNIAVSEYSSPETIVISNVVEGAKNDGIVISFDSVDSIIAENLCKSNGRHGIFVSGTQERVVVIGNICIENSESGIQLDSVSRVVVSGNLSRNNGTFGIDLIKSDLNSIISNIVLRNGYTGISLRGSKYNAVKGNIVEGNSTADPGTYFGIGLYNFGDVYSLYNVVTGNICIDLQTEKTQGYGIRETGSTDYTVITDNVVVENLTGAILVVGANTIVRNNIGYPTENSGTVTFSGDGSTTEFKIEHGLVSTPSKYVVSPLTPDAHADKTISVDDTYIIITFSTAPPSGTDNLKFGWWAEV